MAIIQIAAAPAKVIIIWSSGQSICSAVNPIVGGLLFPYILKLSFSISIVRKTYCDLFDASRLFFFQLSQIVFDNNSAEPTRFQRALRLLNQRLAHLRRTTTTSTAVDDHSLHALSMIAL